ncbi:DedA family protein [Corynebacterium sp. H130]|uniref:DedA family protein n=1 Tax=Corynebacterium sp. H130 TaxID=3133444 RepID=UPI0030B199BF
MSSIVDWVVSLMATLGAPGVGVAILLENLFPPIPSEVVLPLAGFTAAQGKMNVYLAFVFATIGSVVGAYILYWVGAAVGAERLRKIADWMWLTTREDVDKSLHWFDKYGTWSILIGRLIPGIRSLISIPAGIDRMNLLQFGLYTTLGSAVWNAILVALGYWLGDRYTIVADVIDKYSNVVYAIVGIALVWLFVHLVRRDIKSKRAAEQ